MGGKEEERRGETKGKKREKGEEGSRETARGGGEEKTWEKKGWPRIFIKKTN